MMGLVAALAAEVLDARALVLVDAADLHLSQDHDPAHDRSLAQDLDDDQEADPDRTNEKHQLHQSVLDLDPDQVNVAHDHDPRYKENIRKIINSPSYSFLGKFG